MASPFVTRLGALALIAVYRFFTWLKAVDLADVDRRWEKWLEKWFPTIIAVLIVVTIISLYTAESVMCSAGRSDCTFAGPALANWLFPK